MAKEKIVYNVEKLNPFFRDTPVWKEFLRDATFEDLIRKANLAVDNAKKNLETFVGVGIIGGELTALAKFLFSVESGLPKNVIIGQSISIGVAIGLGVSALGFANLYSKKKKLQSTIKLIEEEKKKPLDKMQVYENGILMQEMAP